MTYESWRISYQSSEAAARSAWQEMIRLHHRVNELEAQLSAIGAGGVEPLRKPASQQAVQAAVPDGWKWMSIPSRCGGAIMPVRVFEEDGVKYYQPFDWENETAFEWDKRSKGWVEHEVDATTHPSEGVPVQVVELEVDDLIDRLLNAQQDLNLAANVHMDQSIASASTLLDEVEIALRTLAATQPREAAPVELPESGEFQCRFKPDWDDEYQWTYWKQCTPESASYYLENPNVHGWTHEVRKIYTEQQVRKLLAAAKVERKPLTDEAIRTLYGESDGHWQMVGPQVLCFARSIESAHGIQEQST